jgi:hypothetical protein
LQEGAAMGDIGEQRSISTRVSWCSMSTSVAARVMLAKRGASLSLSGEVRRKASRTFCAMV